MSDNASWFYGERLPEIAREHNCSLEEAERIFRDEKDMLTPKETKENKIKFKIDKDVLHKLMLMAHERDIPLNKLIGMALEDQLKQAEYKYEHGPTPQFLAENK